MYVSHQRIRHILSFVRSFMNPPTREPLLSESLLHSLNDHTAELKDRVVNRARDLAAQRAASAGVTQTITIPDLSQAINDVMCESGKEPTRPTGFQKWFALFPPFTCVCALL